GSAGMTVRRDHRRLSTTPSSPWRDFSFGRIGLVKDAPKARRVAAGRSPVLDQAGRRGALLRQGFEGEVCLGADDPLQTAVGLETFTT
ncbi:MAG TPA: hypothetical protein VFN88_08550, partial [Caulobacteraceae bacterium]|nr:hypothetical protein [Caulobacteraceae bacterium]